MKKIALVTGASRGIGKAIALELANDGFEVIVHYNKSKKEAESVANTIDSGGGIASIIQADLTNDDAVTALFKEISQKHNHLDLLVNNAGFDYGKLIEEFSLKEMRYVIDAILFHKIACTKLALPLLKKSNYPTIINIASRMGKEKTIPTVGAYAPAEAGVIKWTQCCALEFAKYKIRVNCVAPGLTDTDMTRGILEEDDFIVAADKNPRGRVGKPEDIAKVVSFLASENADYINGECIGVNGGSNLG